MNKALSFEIHARGSSESPKSKARAGTITTLHGAIQTPAFVPVGTKAGVKGILPEQLTKLGAQAVLANTYHLYLQPGEQVVKQGGGLAKFMNWRQESNDVGEQTSVGEHQVVLEKGDWRGRPFAEKQLDASAAYAPTMTDSGGFQVFSLGAAFGKTITKIASGEELARTEEEQQQAKEAAAKARTQTAAVYDENVASQHGQLAIVDDEGVTFTSHLDGSLHRFTPERSVEIQHALGADMFFAFDECTSPTEPYEYQREAMLRTHRWAKRSLIAHRQNIEANRTQSIFGIVQGGRHEDLRSESAREIASMDFDGFGIGGSFSKEDMQGSLEAAVKELPENKPRHFLGIGEPGDILTGIEQGMDLFDCVAATRLGRHGTIYTKRGTINLTNEKFRDDFTSLDPETVVPGTEGFTKAYVSHLLRANEILGQMIASMHNVGFIIQLVDGAREAIINGNFQTYREDFIRNYY